MNRTKYLFSLAVSGTASLILLGVAVLQLMNGGYFIFMLDILAAALTFPPAREKLLGRFEERFSDAALARIIGALVAISLAGLAGNFMAKQDAEALHKKELVAQEKAEKEKSLNQHFERNRIAILSEVSQAIEDGRLDQAAVELDKYSLADEELSKLKNKLKISQLQKKLTRTDLSLDEKAVAYKSLSELMPNDNKVSATAKKLSDEVEKRNQLAAAKAQRAKEIESQFSAWDGSHIRVEAAIKERMNDPDSYKHVKTRYVAIKTGLIVFTTFRGANAFGGIITKTVTAQVDLDGNVVSLNF